MKRSYKVFISSTYTDLVQERLAVVLTILKLGHIPTGMELFIAGRPSIDIIEEAINDCDIYILICGKVYGSIYSDNISYTEYEYEYAKKLEKPRFSIVQNIKTKEKIDDKQHSFRKKVMSDQCEFFSNTSDLKSSISTCLLHVIDRNRDIMNGYLDFKEMYNYNNLKNFVFSKDMSAYKIIEPILLPFDDKFQIALTKILNTDICQSTLDSLNTCFDTDTINVFIQENLNTALNNIVISLRAIDTDKKNSQFITEDMDEDMKNIKYAMLQTLLDKTQELKGIIRDQSYFFALHSKGGNTNV